MFKTAFQHISRDCFVIEVPLYFSAIINFYHELPPLYDSFFFSRISNQVSQRVLLGFAGILTAGLAIISSFGFCAAVGVDFVSIVGVVPFLVIGSMMF